MQAVANARAREAADLEPACVDAPADPDGRWSAKDHLAHLAWWRWRSARVLESVGTGGEPPARSPDDASQNAIIYAETKDKSAADVLRDARASWSALEEAIEASTEEDLVRPHPNAPESPAWETVPGLGGHLGVHLMFWFMNNGDAGRAESAAKWGYELECSLLPDPVKHADASYNLACFYARVGRVEEALPLLRESFEVNPNLIELARTDPDLDAIRGEPALQELLA